MDNIKSHIFFDFDGLKYNTFPQFAQYYNQRYGLRIDPAEFNQEKDAYVLVSRHFPEGTGISKSELYGNCTNEFLTSIEWHSSVEPYDGMVEVVKELSRKKMLHTVTARQISGLNSIEYLNSKFIPGCISQVHCAWHVLDNGKYEEKPKIDFILSVQGKLKAFIDDTPREILVAQDHLTSILFDPHHAFDSNKNIKLRAHSWPELGEMLL